MIDKITAAKLAAVYRESEALYREAANVEKARCEAAVARGDEAAEKRYSSLYSRLIGYAGKEAQKAKAFETAGGME